MPIFLTDSQINLSLDIIHYCVGGFTSCHKAYGWWLAFLVFDRFHVYKMNKNNSENYVLKTH